ncbi:hypothetical protein ACFLZH_06030 [Patescibacteria group bacterium]
MSFEFDPSECFIDWRGDEEQHRNGDIIISPEDVLPLRVYIEMMVKWVLENQVLYPEEGKLKADIHLGGIGEVRANLGHSYIKPDSVCDPGNDCNPEMRISTDDGPKFIVKPDHEGGPKIINRTDQVNWNERVNEISRAIIKAINDEHKHPLDGWEEIIEKINLSAKALKRRYRKNTPNAFRVELFRCNRPDMPEFSLSKSRNGDEFLTAVAKRLVKSMNKKLETFQDFEWEVQSLNIGFVGNQWPDMRFSGTMRRKEY